MVKSDGRVCPEGTRHFEENAYRILTKKKAREKREKQTIKTHFKKVLNGIDCFSSERGK